MKFGPEDLKQAEGTVLAHSLRVGGRRFAKGQVLDAPVLAFLADHGLAQVVVARLGPDDLDENAAAAALAEGLATAEIAVTEPFAGRVNLIAKTAGVLTVDARAVDRLNQVDEAITLATLNNHAQLRKGALVATFKIIPYGIDKNKVFQAKSGFDAGAIRLHPFRSGVADLVLTRTEGFKETLLDKGRVAVQRRLEVLGWRLGKVTVVAHEQSAVAAALDQSRADMMLILGASATSDRQDVAPAAVVAAGGRIDRFGMPVDPGNLLFLGDLQGRPVVGLPGCVRTPALNGADWVLARLACGLTLGTADIANMGVGGLLKEIPERQQPRRARGPVDKGKVELVLLAAGKSSRMQGQNKMLREINGEPLLRHAARAALGSKVASVLVVVPPDAPEHAKALHGLDVQVVIAPDAALGLSASVRAGIAAVSPDSAAVIMALADMPEIAAHHFDALIDGYAPEKEGFIVVPLAPNGKRGNPALFDRRYFESLAGLHGDRGAKPIIDQAGSALVTVTLDEAVLLDLDTPEAWAAWEKNRKTPDKS
jgi:molybdenum cofactor cytidylyltransferase